MAKSSSLIALLGLLAVAGYQNRDKISDALRNSQAGTGGSGQGGLGGILNGAQGAGGLGGILGGLGDLINGKSGSNGNVLTGGLNDLLDSFRGNGQRETADSWTTPGVPTRGLNASEVESAIGRDTLTELAQATGMSYDELVQRLSKNIPDAVDRLTPEGRFPATDDEARSSLFRA